jgi:hypothetical protein
MARSWISLRDLQTRNNTKHHIFRVEDTDVSLSMQCATHFEAPFIEKSMLKRGKVRGDKTRIADMEAFKLHTLKAPGLLPIKQVEFYKKFRPFVPREYWEYTFPRPSDEVLAEFKDKFSKKRKMKATAAKSAPKKRGWRPQKKDAPKDNNAKVVAVAAAAAKGNDDT